MTFLNTEIRFFQNMKCSNSTNTYVQNMTGQRANTLMLDSDKYWTIHPSNNLQQFEQWTSPGIQIPTVLTSS